MVRRYRHCTKSRQKNEFIQHLANSEIILWIYDQREVDIICGRRSQIGLTLAPVGGCEVNHTLFFSQVRNDVYVKDTLCISQGRRGIAETAFVCAYSL